MIINHNITSLNTLNKLTANNNSVSKSLEKLSSGLRINRAGDDAAGLSISEKMRGQIRGLDQAGSNAQDGISLIQTAEGALGETTNILQRMRELAVQSSTDTNTSTDRTAMQTEVDQLAKEITRISTDTEFNTKKLLNGNMGMTFTPTTSTATLQGLQANGTSLVNGTYTLTMTATGTDTFGTFANSMTGGTVVGDLAVHAAAQDSYGNYSLVASNYNAGSHTADLTLTGPDGTQTVLSGADVTADQNIAGIDVKFSSHAATSNGTMSFALTSNGLQIGVTAAPPGGQTATPGAIAAYAGSQLNIGGFEFSVKTNHGANATVVTGQLNDQSIKFQIGANQDQNTSMSVNNMSATALGVSAINVTTQAGANAAITTIQSAIDAVSAERSKLGATQNRLEHTINNLSTTSENMTAAESRIRDVDMAKEMTNFQKNSILSQAATAMLAQANQQPQSVLQLLK